MKRLPRTRRGWITVALVLVGVFLLVVGLFSLFWNPKEREYEIVFSSGTAETSRHKIAEYFADEGRLRNLDVKLRDTIGSIETLDLVEQREIDVALIQGGLRLKGRKHVRQVAALYLEPLQLLVRPEFYEACQDNLKSLAGKRIQVGQQGSVYGKSPGKRP